MSEGITDRDINERSYRDRIARALDLLNAGLLPFVRRKLIAAYGDAWEGEARNALHMDQRSREMELHWDTQNLLAIMEYRWNQVFGAALGRTERSLVNELRDVRNAWAHQKPFDLDKTYRAIDTMYRLLSAVSTPEAEELNVQRRELWDLIYENKGGAATGPTEGEPSATGTGTDGTGAMGPGEDHDSGLRCDVEEPESEELLRPPIDLRRKAYVGPLAKRLGLVPKLIKKTNRRNYHSLGSNVEVAVEVYSRLLETGELLRNADLGGRSTLRARLAFRLYEEGLIASADIGDEPMKNDDADRLYTRLEHPYSPKQVEEYICWIGRGKKS